MAKIKETEQIATGFSFDRGRIQEKVWENDPGFLYSQKDIGQ
jgi:hypothetical protein